MFKNRALTIKMEKRGKDDSPETPHTDNFERRADAVLFRLEDLGAKMFLGVCAYILLDTYRQVKVANAIYHPER